MSTHFQQQSPDRNLNLVKAAAMAQHGKKAGLDLPKPKEPRSFQPKPRMS